MDDHYIVSSQFLTKLSDRFDKMQSFDISDSSADFYQRHIAMCGKRFDSLFDFIGDMWDDLYGLAEIVSSSLFFYDRKINLT